MEWCSMPNQKPRTTRGPRRGESTRDPYRLLFENNPHPMWVYDLETLAFLAVNDTAVRRYGYSREEFLGMTIKGICPPEDVPVLPENVAQGSEGLDEARVWRHRTKDGTSIEVEIVSRTLTFADRRAELVLAQDVTDRRRAAQALRESERRLATLFRSSPDMVGIVSLTEGRYLDVSDGYGQVLGYARDELIGRTIHELGIWVDALPRATLVDALTRDGAVRNWEIQYRTKSGRVVIGLVSAELIDYAGAPCVLSVTRDITERKQTEAALRESEAKLRSIFRATPAGIGVVVHRVLKAANQRLCEMVGYAEDELVNQSARLLYPTDEAFAYVGREKYAQIAAAGVGTVETRWRRKDGTLLDVLLSSAPMEPGNWDAEVIFTALDITDRTRAAEERKQLEEQMQHVQKLESLGVLAGGIAHDFNNLLMAILGNADLALLALPPDSPARQHLQEIERASRRAADLCRQMLAYSGKGRFVVERHDLSELVREMTHMLEVSVSKRATVEYRFASDLPAVEADATQLRQIVMNLMTNASEALGDQRGTIAVTTGTRRFHRAFLRESLLGADLAEGDYVYLEVADTGCGMDAATRERIFDPFFTTKFAGRGLGLAAVLGIVRGHGGAIRVQSAPAQGSTFTVLLPAVPGVVRAETRRAGADADWQGAGTVLLVDDEEAVRTVGARMLEWSGFQVLSVADGDEALAVYRQHADAIVCVLLDLTMPGLSGEETFAELRRLRGDVRVVLSSGYDADEVAGRFEGQGPAGFIQKPYTMEALRAALRRALQ
jgi:PAS domain S-box-containing protein